jgi:hypothetical protein
LAGCETLARSLIHEASFSIGLATGRGRRSIGFASAVGNGSTLDVGADDTPTRARSL